MSDWNAVVLGSATSKIGSGATPRGGESVYRDEGVALIRSQNVLDNGMRTHDIARISEDAADALSGVTVKAGDVLINITGDSVARVALVDPSILPARVNQHVAIIRPTNELNSLFLQKLLVSPAMKSQLLVMATGGATRNALTRSQLMNFVIPLPPRHEQQAIADVLGALDDKIAANSRLLSRADELIATQFNLEVMKQAESAPLLEELRIEYGEPFGGEFFGAPGAGRPLIRIRDLKTFQSQVWTQESRGGEIEIDAGDVLVGMDAEFRASTWLGERGVLNQRVLRASHERYGNALVREALRQPLSEIENEKSATTVIHLNKSDLARKSVMMPAGAALREFERLAEPLYDARVAVAKENRTLAATRDALLPQLLSGGLRVRNAGAIAADAGA